MRLISAKSILGLSALLLTAACTDEQVENPADGARPIAFTPAAETRAAVDGSSLPSSSSFRVWGWYGTGNDINKNVFNNPFETVMESNGSWGYTGGTQYWIPGMTYNFYGVYPASVTASVTNDGTITVSNFDCSATGADAVDLMTATETGLSGDDAPTVAMQFQHELARVKFQTKTQGSKVTLTSFKINSVSYKGDFSHQLPSGNAQWTTKQSTVTGDGIFSVTDKTIESTTDELVTDLLGDLLILPQTLETGQQQIAISYRYDGETTDRTKTIDLRIENGTTGWTAGQSYVYTLDLRTASLTLTVTIQPWMSQDADVDWKPSKP